MTQPGVSHIDESRTHRAILGLRVSALVETLLFLAVALLVDSLLGAGDRFSEISPHPFWIIVLLVSTYYGTNEGLATAALCAIAALAGHIPEQGFNEESTAWLLRVSADPVLWIMAALLLGEIRSGHRHRFEALKGTLENARRQVAAIAQAYEMLSESKSTLEVRVAAQVQTVQSVYRASRAIERQAPDDVLAGIPDLVRAIMAPGKFRLGERGLACKRWVSEDIRILVASVPGHRRPSADAACLRHVPRVDSRGPGNSRGASGACADGSGLRHAEDRAHRPDGPEPGERAELQDPVRMDRHRLCERRTDRGAEGGA
jgi:hypothetical protein